MQSPAQARYAGVGIQQRLRGELDYAVNRRAESEIQALSRKLHLVGDKLEDVEDLVRSLKASR